MKRFPCYIGFGSNLGDRVANCRSALQALSRLPDTEITAVSSLYETEPVYSEGLAWPARAPGQASGSASDWPGHGGIESEASRPPYLNAAGVSEDPSSPHPHGPLHRKDQGSWFLNGAVELSTDLGPEELLEDCQEIEVQLGRIRFGPTASPRTIDLDILLYGKEVFTTPALKIPHPRMHERAFVLIPLTEIAPKGWHPVLQKDITELLTQLKDTHEVKRIAPPDALYPYEGSSPF